MKHEIKTKKGYDLFEVASALQKCVRRGLEKEALFWAVELYDSGFSEYAWKRLRIMSSEDVGLAYPSVSSEVWALYQLFKEQAKHKDDKNEPQRLFLTHAVLKLCRAPKSRLVDWLLIWAWLTHPFRQMAIPDFALDKHNERGRKLGRSWRHFFTEGTTLSPMGEVVGEDEAKTLASGAISNPSGNEIFP